MYTNFGPNTDFNNSASTIEVTLKEKNKPASKASFYIGIVLLVLLIAQLSYPITIPDLKALQSNNLFNQISGFIILLITFFQWRLTHLKNSNQGVNIKNVLRSHQWLGAVVPVFIFLHVPSTGYAYQTVLLYGYIGLVFIGLCNYHVFKIRKKWYINGWIILHISLATACLALMVYHVYITYTYS